MPWSGKRSFKLVALKDVKRLTGIAPAELLLMTNTQKLTRIDQSGAREELVRVPVELLLEQSESEES